MPHEKINYFKPVEIEFGLEPFERLQAVVGWSDIGWVQLSLYPEGWTNTGDAHRVDLTEPEVDKLIKTLKRAKRVAYSKGNRHVGYEDREPLPNDSELFDN